jgi:ADP-ribosylglycohydrolase
MALCLAESLIEKNGVFDGLDQQQRYHRWYQDGHLSSTGKCFDVGKTVLKHLLDNLKVNREFHTNISYGASGNGALMRLAPVPMLYSLQDSDLFITKSAANSMTTHPSEISRDACRYYAALIVGAIHGATKEELLSPLFVPKNLSPDYWTVNPLRQEVLNVVQTCEYKTKNPPDINNGAFVIASLEAALWAFNKFDTFEEGALAVTNLGDDSDTVCAIYGQLAGAYYGMEAIPSKWRQQIVLLPLLLTYAEELYHMAQQLAKNETVTQTEKFKEMQALNAVLETEYAQIMRKVDPSPRQYKNMTILIMTFKHLNKLMNKLLFNM